MTTRVPTASLRSRTAYSLAILCLFSILAGELWLSVARLSPTLDETAHLYAGYQYWKAHDYGLNPEHPPLLKLVAALPILPLTLQQPHPPSFSSKAEEYIGGDQLLYGNGADRLLLRARIAASLFSFLLAAVVFAAGYEMFGAGTALIGLALLVFEPTLLAHGALVTTDMAAACTIFAAVYALYRYQTHRTLPRLLVLGLTLGIAAAAKFSAPVLLPIFFVCVVADIWLRPRSAVVGQATIPDSRFLTAYWQRALGWLAVFAIAWVVLWTFYGFSYAARPGAAQFAPTLPVYAQQLHSHAEARLILALARWHLFPESFLYGLVDMQVFGAHMPSFLLGHVYPGATRWFFPVAFVIKSTLPVLLLLGALPFLLSSHFVHFRRELLFLGVPAVIYMTVSLFAPQNIGVRHILPIFPFVILLAALSAWLLASRSRMGTYAAAALLLFHAASSVHAFPDYLPYGNEAFGGPQKTYQHLTDSNVDWGQSLKEVRAYLSKNHITDCWFVPMGGSFFVHAPYYQLPCKELPSSFMYAIGFPIPIIPPTVHGTILVSASEASGLFAGPGVLNPYAELMHRPPDAMVGNSVLVFRGDVHLPLAAAQGHARAASTLLQQGKFPQALDEAQIAVSLAPAAPDVLTTYGAALIKSSQPEAARAAFDRARRSAHEIDPGDWLKTDTMIAAIH